MYNIPHFKGAEGEEVIRFMKAHSFGVLMGCANDVPAATQVPFLFEERGAKLMLKGHMMRNTDHHAALLKNNQVLCLFTGGHAYVSARWYLNQQTASTWNYMSVHVRGLIKFVGNEALVKILQETTDFFENDADSPSNFKNLPTEYVTKLSNAIAGFEIEVNEIDHVFKLSQNKKEEEYSAIIKHLSALGSNEKSIAAEMQLRKAGLFPSHNGIYQ